MRLGTGGGYEGVMWLRGGNVLTLRRAWQVCQRLWQQRGHRSRRYAPCLQRASEYTLAVEEDTYILTNEDVWDRSLTGFLAKVLLEVITVITLVQSRHVKLVPRVSFGTRDRGTHS